MSYLPQLKAIQAALDSSWSLVEVPALVTIIDSALGIPGPDGSPAAISEQGHAYAQAGATAKNVATDLHDVARNKIPAAWRGVAADTASRTVDAATTDVDTTARVLVRAGHALATWSENLRSAQRHDHTGRAALSSAQDRLGSLSAVASGSGQHEDLSALRAAVDEARSGIALVVRGASVAREAGEAAASILRDLAGHGSAKRGYPLNSLKNVKNASSDGGGDILTSAELSRASAMLKDMTPAERAKFEALLTDAKSKPEAAFIVKALAAGNSLSAVEQFDKLIHTHGNNLTWLSQHLSPNLTTDTYDGQRYFYWPSAHGDYYILSQGNVGDCVAASTVVALAKLDPVFMLKLTTGDHPGIRGSDSPTQFEHRLQHAYISQYQEGQRADGSPVYPHANQGLTPPGETLLTNSDLGHATGLQYHYQTLDGSSDNQAVLPQIEKAVSSGQPVPIDIINASGTKAHQIMIIGQSGDKLQIYNPWGTTHWVTTQQFVNNQLGSVTGGEMPRAYAMEMPS
jgi:uncharacterized protein YukE